MPFNDRCAVCTAENTEAQEAVGLLVLDGEISWREAARRLELPHGKGLQNHMDRHYEPPGSAEQQGIEARLELRYRQQIAQAVEGLLDKMEVAPAEVKPLYATAIKNLRELDATKASQQQLVAALKAVHEITGMKMGQQMLLQFAQAAFDKNVKAAELPEAQPALAGTVSMEVLEAELVE